MVLTCCWIVSAAHALDPLRAITQYGHDVWHKRQGLPDYSVYQVAQTSDGYLWLGTVAGVVRFDGVTFKLVGKPHIKGEIQALRADAQGGLWIGTRHALYRLHDGQYTTYALAADATRDAMVLDIALGDSGEVWVATHGGGLLKVEGDKLVSATDDAALRVANVYCLALGKEGTLWAGTDQGLYEVRAGKVTRHSTAEGLTHDSIKSLAAMPDGTLWIGTRRGVSIRATGGGIGAAPVPALREAVVIAIARDRGGNIWIGTLDEGLHRLGERADRMGKEQGFAARAVAAIFEDREGSLWVGTEEGGLHRLRDQPFIAHGERDGFPSAPVTALLGDHSGALWAGTDGAGLAHLANGRATYYTTKQGLADDTILSLHEDRQGALWIGTRYGLSVYDGSKLKGVIPTLTDAINTVHRDARGRLWIGTSNRLIRYEDGQLKSFTTQEGLPSNLVTTLFARRDGSMWIGTGGGLVELRDEQLRNPLAPGERLSDNLVNCMYEDAQGVMWVGTFVGGLNRVQEGKVISYAAHLPVSSVGQMVEDETGNLWLGADGGRVMRVSKQALNGFAEGKRAPPSYAIYDTSDGLPEAPIAPGSLWKGRDGTLWFPSSKGLLSVDPAKLNTNRLAPPVRIESLVTDQQEESLEHNDAVSLAAGTRRLEIQYTALSFLAPDRMRFRYRLEGVDAAWTEAGTRRTAYYTNLSPGDYTFRVIASNNDGVWNDAGASLRIKVAPLFYQTKAFYALCVVLGAALLFGAYRWRVHQLAHRHALVLNERTRLARELHDTLISEVTGVAAQLDAVSLMLTRDPADAASRLEVARGMVRHAIDGARHAVKTLRADFELTTNLVDALRDMTNRLAGASQARVTFATQGKPFELPPAVAWNVIQIASEATQNAVQHAQASTVEISLEYDASELSLRVRDDGKGLDAASVEQVDQGHFGLIGMHERAQQVGGKLSIVSEPAGGTRVKLRVPRPT